MAALSRRQFLALACGGMCSCAVAATYQGNLEGDRLLVRLDGLPASFAEQGYTLVRAAGVADPVLIHRIEGGGFQALSARRTHLGCQVRPAQRFLTCPCHGSTFAWDGTVVRGPAQKGLPRYSVELREGILEITVD